MINFAENYQNPILSHLDQFKKYLKEQSLSEISIKNYLADINKFLNWQDIIDFKPEHFTNYCQNLLKQQIPLSTYKRHLSSLRQFGRFLVSSRIARENPAEKLAVINQLTTGAKAWGWDKLLDRFTKHLTANHHSQNTIKNYRADLRQFCRWLESRSQ